MKKTPEMSSIHQGLRRYMEQRKRMTERTVFPRRVGDRRPFLPLTAVLVAEANRQPIQAGNGTDDRHICNLLYVGQWPAVGYASNTRKMEK